MGWDMLQLGGHWCPQGVVLWPPLAGSKSVIAGTNLSFPCLSSSKGFSIAEMVGTSLSSAKVAEANYGGIFSTQTIDPTLCMADH